MPSAVAVTTCAGAALILALAHRKRRGKHRRPLSSPITRLFVVRHAERQDHLCPEWAAQASRPHDSPLSDAGFEQARRSGARLRALGVSHVRSSPLIRTVQTAACLTAAMGEPELVVQVDEALCEEEQFLRPRMMGTH